LLFRLLGRHGILLREARSRPRARGRAAPRPPREGREERRPPRLARAAGLSFLRGALLGLPRDALGPLAAREDGPRARPRPRRRAGAGPLGARWRGESRP